MPKKQRKMKGDGFLGDLIKNNRKLLVDTIRNPVKNLVNRGADFALNKLAGDGLVMTYDKPRKQRVVSYEPRQRGGMGSVSGGRAMIDGGRAYVYRTNLMS